MDECLVGKLRERVLEERVVGELLARRRLLLEAIDLLLRVRENEPVVVLLLEHELSGRPVSFPFSIIRRNASASFGFVTRNHIRPVVREVEPDEVDLVAESRLDVLLVVETRVLLQGRAERRERLGADRELAEELVDLLPLVGAEIGVDRDEDRRGRRDDLGAAARSCLLLRPAAGDGERESDEQGDANQAH